MPKASQATIGTMLLLGLTLATPVFGNEPPAKEPTSITVIQQPEDSEHYVYAVRVIVVGIDPSRTLSLKWGAVPTAENGYLIERSSDAKTFVVRAKVPSGVTQHIESNLIPGNYLYRVRVNDPRAAGATRDR